MVESGLLPVLGVGPVSLGAGPLCQYCARPLWRWVRFVFVRANAYGCLPLLDGLNPVGPEGESCFCQDLGCVFN